MRLVFHFHTRIKTGRSPPLQEAAPDDFLQVAEEDAERLGIEEGEWIKVTSRGGTAEAQARVGGITPSHLFVPFHFGHWDNLGRARAANELTLFDWDPLSKQPHFKHSAVRLEKGNGPTTRQPQTVHLHPEQMSASGAVAGAAAAGVVRVVKGVAETVVGLVTPEPRKHLPDYIGLLIESEDLLARAFDQAIETHTNRRAGDAPPRHAVVETLHSRARACREQERAHRVHERGQRRAKQRNGVAK